MVAQGLVNTAFVGHLSNPNYLSGMGMGNSIQNIFGLSIIMGLNYAFEIISAQTKGAGNLELIGV